MSVYKSYDMVVDTTEMADEVKRVSSHVDGTTAAVGIMQTAVIAAEVKGAELVCQKVNQGFFGMLRSQLTQKTAVLKSEADAIFIQLQQQRAALLGIKGRMERDYHRIASRYLKLFRGINADLERQVFELDKPAAEFARQEVEKIANRPRRLVATVPVVQSESLTVSQQILASRAKRGGAAVIRSVKKFLSETEGQRRLLDRRLVGNASFAAGRLTLPVVIMESGRGDAGQPGVSVEFPSGALDAAARNAIRNAALAGANNFGAGVTVSGGARAEVARLLSASARPARVLDMTRRLLRENNLAD